MRPHKIRIEFYDEDGTKHSLSLEGEITRDKLSRVLDYVELMGVSPSLHRQASFPRHKFERIIDLVGTKFSGRLFGSVELKDAYETSYGESIALSTVSTYLSRLADRGVLNRAGSAANLRYALRVLPRDTTT